VTALCDAISHLGRIRDETQDPKMDTAVAHLVHAAADIPAEYYGHMPAEHHVGVDELAARLNSTVREAVPA